MNSSGLINFYIKIQSSFDYSLHSFRFGWTIVIIKTYTSHWWRWKFPWAWHEEATDTSVVTRCKLTRYRWQNSSSRRRRVQRPRCHFITIRIFLLSGVSRVNTAQSTPTFLLHRGLLLHSLSCIFRNEWHRGDGCVILWNFVFRLRSYRVVSGNERREWFVLIAITVVLRIRIFC